MDEIASIPLGLGDIKVHYLDSNYQPAAADTGITVLAVENNEMAKGVLVLAEVPDNDVKNGSVVRVINSNNGSLVSLFYYEGQKFPHKMLITRDGKTVQAQFSQYSMTNQNFSLSLEYEGEYSTIDDIGMNIDVLTLYTFQDELSESQNVRMQNIVISLAIWDCIALQIPGSDFTVTARSLTSFLKGLLVTVFAVVAVVAFVAAVIIAGPAAITMAGPMITIALESTAATVAAGIGFVSAVTAVVISTLPVEDISSQGTSAAIDPKPQVTVKRGGTAVPNGNWDSPYYLVPGDPPENPPPESSMTFDLQFFVPDASSIASPEVGKFDPRLELYGDPAGSNNYFFSIEQDVDDNTFKITVKREKALGHIEDGRMRVIIKFNQDFVINDSYGGVMFQDAGETEPRNRKDIFILDFTVLEPTP
jgi:hypothetical protein